jgi:predicted branched-subunit amino acid permease
MRSGVKGAALAAVPAAAAIAVFGVIYGSLARPELGIAGTLLSSLLIFSGSVQFTLAALLASGAGIPALLLGATTLNLRNLALGAVMRPRVRGSRLRRAAYGWFLTDEAVGLAVVSEREPSRTLVISGALFYVSWQVGTLLGVMGASLDQLAQTASAVFPVLFIGLAAMAAASWSIAARSLCAAILAGVAALLWPGSEAVIAVAVAIAAAVPERQL